MVVELSCNSTSGLKRQMGHLCIREAMGQLLEYSHYPGSPSVERMIVVGEGVLDQDGEEYLRRLKDRFNLPIAYEQVSI